MFALDVDTGDTIWKYEGNLDERINTVCCGWTSRGVAIGDGRVYLGRLDGTLVALDAGSGKEVWSTAHGQWKKGETITSAPLYYDGLVVTGISGGEFGIRGSVTAYDAETGEEAWRFYTIPGPGETGHETWPQDNDAWKHGGAPVWQTPAVDPELGLLYFSTGNTAPDFDGSSRKGDNLFANSIVAIDAKTGEYRWHFQQIHHDIWDLDAPSPVVLFDLEVDGQAAARTRGGEQDGLGLHPRPDEWRAAHRNRREASSAGAAPAHFCDAAVSRWATAFVPQSISAEEVTRLQKARAAAAREAGGEDELGTPKWNYVNEGRIFTPFWGQTGVIAKPSTIGGTNWPPSSYNPDTGYLYVCAADAISIFTSSEVEYNPAEIEKGNDFLGSAFNAPDGNIVNGTFTAMDMQTNRSPGRRTGITAATAARSRPQAGSCSWGTTTGGSLRTTHATASSSGSSRRGPAQTRPRPSSSATAKQYVMLVAAGSALGGTTHGDNVWLFGLDGDLGPATPGK